MQFFDSLRANKHKKDLEKKASKGDAEALYDLACLTSHSDKAKAFPLLIEAGEKGSIKALEALCCIYEGDDHSFVGFGNDRLPIAQDMEKAFRCALKGAQLGSQLCTALVAYDYKNGRGTSINLEQAHYWDAKCDSKITAW